MLILDHINCTRIQNQSLGENNKKVEIIYGNVAAFSDKVKLLRKKVGYMMTTVECTLIRNQVFKKFEVPTQLICLRRMNG